jgi:NADPH:quinone reductase-like Zn-dependent oxidoreductase
MVIVHGGSGGVGTLAIQFAKRRGARVLATASGTAGVALVKKLGADAAVDGKNGDVGAAIAAFAPDGVDAVLGLIGGDALERCLEALKADGRFAYPHGIEPEPKKHRRIRTIPYDAMAGPREFERLNRAVVAARLQVPIAAEFPLSKAAKAQERLSKRPILGKIILTME